MKDVSEMTMEEMLESAEVTLAKARIPLVIPKGEWKRKFASRRLLCQYKLEQEIEKHEVFYSGSSRLGFGDCGYEVPKSGMAAWEAERSQILNEHGFRNYEEFLMDTSDCPEPPKTHWLEYEPS